MPLKSDDPTVFDWFDWRAKDKPRTLTSKWEFAPKWEFRPIAPTAQARYRQFVAGLVRMRKAGRLDDDQLVSVLEWACAKYVLYQGERVVRQFLAGLFDPGQEEALHAALAFLTEDE